MEPTTVAGRRLHEETHKGVLEPCDYIANILAIEAEARATAVAPVLEALREKVEAEIRPDDITGDPWAQGHSMGWDSALGWVRDVVLSAPLLRPSGEPEPGGLDVAET